MTYKPTAIILINNPLTVVLEAMESLETVVLQARFLVVDLNPIHHENLKMRYIQRSVPTIIGKKDKLLGYDNQRYYSFAGAQGILQNSKHSLF